MTEARVINEGVRLPKDGEAQAIREAERLAEILGYERCSSTPRCYVHGGDDAADRCSVAKADYEAARARERAENDGRDAVLEAAEDVRHHEDMRSCAESQAYARRERYERESARGAYVPAGVGSLGLERRR